MAAVESSEVSRKAEQLLAAHHRERPLLLPNAWDVASAQAVADTGFQVVATSSRAVAQVLGEADDDSSDPGVVFSFIAKIARSVPVPVTADMQAGLRLDPAELVGRLLEAGAVGCNLEDSDHRGGGILVDAERQAAFLTDVRRAAVQQGVHVVVNARIDNFIRQLGDPATRVDEATRRARLYLEAGADCVYPIGVARLEDAAELVSAIPGPVNLLARKGGLSISELASVGARRISLAAGVFDLVAECHHEILRGLAAGADLGGL